MNKGFYCHFCSYWRSATFGNQCRRTLRFSVLRHYNKHGLKFALNGFSTRCRALEFLRTLLKCLSHNIQNDLLSSGGAPS